MFKRVAIVGVGLIGGSLGLALRGRGLAREVVGVGRSVPSLHRALALGAISEFTDDLNSGVSGADLVVLATPIRTILTDLERLPHSLQKSAIVTDVGSTKGMISLRGDQFISDGRFVPGHPMAGSEKSGVDSARPDLFMGATWALTPTEKTDADALGRMRDLVAALGARVRELSPSEHDRAVAITSHLPHVLAYALSVVAGEGAAAYPPLYDLAAGSFASGTRVARSDPALWVEIALSNRQALADAVRKSRAQLDDVLAALEVNDEAALRVSFERGHNAASQAAKE